MDSDISKSSIEDLLDLYAEHKHRYLWEDGPSEPMDAVTDEVERRIRVPDGHVRLGVTDHKLLGTLPMTADGCVIGDGAQVWPRADLYIFKNDGRPSDVSPWTADEESATSCFMLNENSTGDTIAPEEWHADNVYSSPEAAEAARGEGCNT